MAVRSLLIMSPDDPERLKCDGVGPVISCFVGRAPDQGQLALASFVSEPCHKTRDQCDQFSARNWQLGPTS